MNQPLKMLLVERRQSDGCLKRALQGDLGIEFQWCRVYSENELRSVAREYGPTVVLSADEMQGRSHQMIVQMLCMFSPQRPHVMICEVGDAGASWLCASPGEAAEAAEMSLTQPLATAQGMSAGNAAETASGSWSDTGVVDPAQMHIFQTTQDAVLMLDADGWIRQINAHARGLLGARACDPSRSKLHVSELIGALQGSSEGQRMALPLVAVNLDGLLSLNAIHGMQHANAVIDLIAGAVQPRYARCGFLARLDATQYLAVLPHLSMPADAAVAVNSGKHTSADDDLSTAFGEAKPNTADINCMPAPRKPATDMGVTMRRQALSLHFQPQYNLLSGRGCGVEALARWTLADGRTIAPNLFLSIAERTGTAAVLDTWILEKACAAAAAWRGREGQQLTLSLNVSHRQINADFPRNLAVALERSGVPAQRLELEVEEGPIVANDASTLECLREWKKLGVRIAVNRRSDDYSSLAYLSRVSVDRLKLDKSLIHRMMYDRDTAARVQATIDLGAAMDVDVIAEGVETHAQLEMLQSLGCRHAQGYLLARPMPAAQAQIVLTKAWGNLTANSDSLKAYG